MVDLFAVSTSGDDLNKCLFTLPQVVSNAVEAWKKTYPGTNVVFDVHQFQTLVEMQPVLSTIQGQPAMRPVYKVIAFVVVKSGIK